MDKMKELCVSVTKLDFIKLFNLEVQNRKYFGIVKIYMSLIKLIMVYVLAN